MTLRDEIWDEVLLTLIEKGRFKISELDFTEGERHTVRRVLREMEDLGWLKRTSDRGRIWWAGDLVDEHLKLSEEAKMEITEEGE